MLTSPDLSFFKQLIQFDRTSPQPLYVQVAQQIVNGIQRGQLIKGSKLPGTRSLSKLLKVHRNTVVAIYDELASQGWVEIIPNKGTFVLAPKKKSSEVYKSAKEIHKVYQYPSSTEFSFQEAFHLSPIITASTAKYSITDGKPDVRLHPMHQFTRWFSSSMKRKSLVDKWRQTSNFSIKIFLQELCNHLNVTRGFYIHPNHLMTTRSTEMSLYIVSQLLIKPNDVVLVGALSNYAANMIFQQVGANIQTIPVDDDGLDISYIEKHFKPKQIRCIYTSPQRDYPTTVTLSAERRLQLLQLAKDYSFAIIEDDYDYDFQYDGYAMPPMAASDTNGVVIYLGKFGQSLFPSFQRGFVVAPENLIKEANNYLQILDNQGDYIQEQILAELIHEGEIYRLMKKNNTTYKERRDRLLTLLEKNFQNISKWRTPSGGLAIWLTFEPKISLVQLAKEANTKGLFLPQTLLYQDSNTCSIRLGFGHFNLEELEDALYILKEAYQTIRS